MARMKKPKLSGEEKRARFIASLPARLAQARLGQGAAAYVHGLDPRHAEVREVARALLFLPERVDLAEMEERKIERLREEKASREHLQRATAERAANARSQIAAVATNVEAARASSHSLDELRRAGVGRKDLKEIADWRRGAMTVGKAAEYLGIPTGRLQRWMKCGAVAPSFHRRAAVMGAGTVLAGMWRQDDLDVLSKRLDGVEWRCRAAGKVGKKQGVGVRHSGRVDRRDDRGALPGT